MSNNYPLLTQPVAPRAKKKPKILPWRDRAVPESLHPVVKRLFAEMNAQQVSDVEMAKRSGIAAWTLSNWRHVSNPTVPNLEACLNVLGLELTIRERDQ